MHLGHGHLPQQFLSPASNHRTDAYGGSEANRLRFASEPVRAVREAMGLGFPRASGSPPTSSSPAGWGSPTCSGSPPRSRCTSSNVGHSVYVAGYSLATEIADMHFPQGAFRHLPAGIKAAVPDLPVFAVFPRHHHRRGVEALRNQCIPLDPELHRVENYLQFLDAGRALMASAIAQLINRALEGS